MRLQQVEPGRGTSWVRKGFQVFGRQPLGFASLFAAGLFMSLLLGLIPLLGSVATLALAPAVSLVFMIASRRVGAGQAAMPGAIVELATAGRSRLLALLKLGLVYVAATFLLFWLASVLDGGALGSFFATLRDAKLTPESAAARIAERSPARAIPVLVKISPDSANHELLRSVDAASEGGAAGVIATNTTVSRPSIQGRFATEAGGLSGAPLKNTANAVCKVLYQHLRGRLPIIGVGGIFTADDAYERIRSGATLVQVYTALVYEGPGMIERVLTGLARRLAADGMSRIEEAIGVDAH